MSLRMFELPKNPWYKSPRMLPVGAALVLFLCGWFLIHQASSAIEKGGGMKNIIIDVGKDVKDIGEEIGKH